VEAQRPFLLRLRGSRGLQECWIEARDLDTAQRVAAAAVRRMARLGEGEARIVTIKPAFLADETILITVDGEPPAEAPAGESHAEYAEPAGRHDLRAREKQDRRADARTRNAIASGRIGS
jgi:hypothetical protein